LESSLTISSVYWAVFNRWGEKIFEANQLTDTWDGAYKGQAQPAETYGYYLRVVCGEGQPVYFKKGNVTLLR
jgi:gliding motility-associated-like protein